MSRPIWPRSRRAARKHEGRAEQEAKTERTAANKGVGAFSFPDPFFATKGGASIFPETSVKGGAASSRPFHWLRCLTGARSGRTVGDRDASDAERVTCVHHPCPSKRDRSACTPTGLLGELAGAISGRAGPVRVDAREGMGSGLCGKPRNPAARPDRLSSTHRDA